MRKQQFFTFGKLLWDRSLHTLGFVLTSFSHQGFLDEKLRSRGSGGLSQRSFNSQNSRHLGGWWGRFLFFLLGISLITCPDMRYFMGWSCGQEYISQA